MHAKTSNKRSDNSYKINVRRVMKFRSNHTQHIYMEYKKIQDISLLNFIYAGIYKCKGLIFFNLYTIISKELFEVVGE